MLIHDFIPLYQFSERHQIMTSASPPNVFRAISTLDVSRSPVVRLLYTLRHMPKASLTLDGMKDISFTVLGQIDDEEVVLGLIGRFWKPIPEIVRIDPHLFAGFNEPGYSKAALNFFIQGTPLGSRLSTETRVCCTSTGARILFSAYWAMVRPFSGLIRRSMLRGIRTTAEQYAR